MRLAILISICVVIAALSVVSLVTYHNWRAHRYDHLIMEAAVEHQLPPALLKAIMHARGRFNYYAMGEKGEAGLLQVPQEGVAEYKKAKLGADSEFGYVCINKAYPPHTGIKYSVRGLCNICKSRLIPELWYPEQNIEIGAWYLAKLKTDIEGAAGGTKRDLDDIVPLMVAAYCLTDKNVRAATDDFRHLELPPKLRNSIQDILQKYERYRQRL